MWVLLECSFLNYKWVSVLKSLGTTNSQSYCTNKASIQLAIREQMFSDAEGVKILSTVE